MTELRCYRCSLTIPENTGAIFCGVNLATKEGVGSFLICDSCLNDARKNSGGWNNATTLNHRDKETK